MIRNAHERRLPADPVTVGRLLDALSSPEDSLWPRDRWPAMRFDRPLGVGAHGGHGPIRYTVASLVPGQRVQFHFTKPRGLDGWHRFEVAVDGQETMLRHELEARLGGMMRILWPLVYRPLHDALVEDALDRASAAVAAAFQAAEWTLRVRVLRWVVQACSARCLQAASCGTVRVPSPRRGAPRRSPRFKKVSGHVAEIEIGIGKSGRRAYGFDDIAIVPSRRTRDPEDIDIRWQIDAYEFDLPLLGAAMDGVISPRTAIEIGRLGGLAVLNLEGLWGRYENPDELLEEIATLAPEVATARMQEIYKEPVKEELIGRQVASLKEAGITVAASLTPQKVERFHKTALDSGLDILVIQGTVVSAEHVSTRSQPLNLKEFIARYDIPVIVGGCASYSTALHLMRTGAAGILVGVGPGNACTTRGVLGIGVPQATAIADAAGARSRHLEETGRYVHIIADGGMRTGGDIAKAIAVGADAVMLGSPLARATEAPGGGYHWGMATFHPELPRGARVRVDQIGSLREILLGPALQNDGTLNLFGALKTSMATCGYETIKEFQRAEVMVAPSLQTEGKHYQRAQGVGMGRR